MTTTTPTCPSWCTDHKRHDDWHQSSTMTIGDLRIFLTDEHDVGPRVEIDGSTGKGLTPQQAATLAGVLMAHVQNADEVAPSA